jgi:hypothetical protein
VRCLLYACICRSAANNFHRLPQTFINTAGGALSLARDYVGLQLAMQKVIRVSTPSSKVNNPSAGTSHQCVASSSSASLDAAVTTGCGCGVQDDNNVPIAKATASTPPSEAGYILEYEHGQVRNGTLAVVGSTC